MQCKECGHDNPPDAVRCIECNASLEDEATLVDTQVSDSIPTAQDWTDVDSPSQVRSAVSPLSIQPGSIIAERYEILASLGEGGMGAVYKANDRELDRVVALKVIRPELAAHKEILQRFKQELILARQITHPNVIRIFDIGATRGMRFITMEYIEGKDLRTLINEGGKFTPEETSKLMVQVCRALNAAHSEGVVHRDLKPQNIMVDAEGRVYVMDFGIARSMETPGLTRTGQMIGTPEYMSPEQAKGEKVDHRSDLFTVGVILYEMLVGQQPYKADTPMGTLMRRLNERVDPPNKKNPAVPQHMSDVVLKCLEIEPEHRYESALEILTALEEREKSRVLPTASRFRWWMGRYRKWLVTAAAIAVLGLAGYLIQSGAFRATPAPAEEEAPAVESVALAVLPFQNTSGDSSLDWLGSSLADLLRTDVGQASELRAVSSDRVSQILNDLKVSTNANLDTATLRRLAEFSNAELLLWGRYSKFGEQIRIDATLHDLTNDRNVPLKAEAGSEGEILAAVDQLAQSVQQNLGMSEDVIKELESTSFRPSSSSLAAIRYYSEGLELARQGNHLEAQKRFEDSIHEDPEFALAHSKLAQTYYNLGYDDEAERSSRKAVELVEGLSPQERYRILAADAQIGNDFEKAIDSYENLAQVLPEDPEVQFNLAQNYENAGKLDQARDRYAMVLERDPNYFDALFAMGRAEVMLGNPRGALDHFNGALNLTIELKNDEGKASILNAIGITYKRLNNLDEAFNHYQDSLEIRRRLGDRRGIAASLNEIGQIQHTRGNLEESLASYQEALDIRREIGDRSGIGNSLIDLGGLYDDRGEYDKALDLYKESLQIQRELGNQYYEALCLNNIGGVYLSTGQFSDALTYFDLALQIREKLDVPTEIAETLHNLAETSVKMSRYDRAERFYFRALELWRTAGDERGAAIESYSMGTVFEFLGRYRAALESKEVAVETFKKLDERGYWLIEVLNGCGKTLALMGRFNEADEKLEEALDLARELQNDVFIAQVLGAHGDSYFYRGELETARRLFEEASAAAMRTSDRPLVLSTNADRAKVMVREGNSEEAMSLLRGLPEELDRLGLKHRAAACSLFLAEALLNNRQYTRAREELEAVLDVSQSLRLKALEMESQYLLGRTLRLSWKEDEAVPHYEEASKCLDRLREEAGTDEILNREDLKRIQEESSRYSAETSE